MNSNAALRPSGAVGLLVMRGDPFDGRAPYHPINILKHALPRPGLSTEVNVWRIKNLPNIWVGLWRVWAAWLMTVPTHSGAVFIRRNRGGTLINGRLVGGTWTEYGLASLRVVTTAGVNYLASCFDNTAEPELFKFHGFGTGTTAEATTDTALVTELTTQYATDNVRPTGTQAHSTNTYTTVATLTPDADSGITEHGVFTQAATGGGTLWDRSKFAVVNLVAANPDSLQATYVLTLTAGG